MTSKSLLSKLKHLHGQLQQIRKLAEATELTEAEAFAESLYENTLNAERSVALAIEDIEVAQSRTRSLATILTK